MQLSLFILISLVNKIRLEEIDDEINKVTIEKDIVNKHDFNYILNPGHSLCQNQHDLLVVIYVHSAPENLKRRIAIRDTWAKLSLFKQKVRLVFMLGLDPNSNKKQELIKFESNIYNDVVQEDFHDSYKNLTYKGIMALKWIYTYCDQAKYILKVDDDMIVNTFTLLRHLTSLQRHDITKEKKKTVMCLVWSKMIVQRDKTQKWFLSKEEFKHDYFGKYCSGSAFLLTSDLARPMYNVSFYVKFLWIDDYYISGLLARAVDANYESINSLYTVNRNLVEQQFLGKKSFYTVFGHMPISINKVYQIWNYIIRKEILNELPYEFNWDFSIWEQLKKNEEEIANNNIIDYLNY